MKNTYVDNSPINISMTYPQSDYFEYFTEMIKLDLDKIRSDDIKIGKGFIIDAPQGIKKDIKLQNGIFSSRYGNAGIEDIDSFNGRYRCKCGLKRGSINHGEICEECHTRVVYVGDDVSIMGYLCLKEKYWIIHPNIYRIIEAFIGVDRLNRIIEPEINVDSDGKIIENKVKKDEPFKGIGILEFKERFDEIMEFYLYKYPAKKIYYDEIMKNKNIVFAHTIPVFSSLLRPSKLDNGSLKYEACNEQFNLLANLVYRCNDDDLYINRKKKEKFQLLYDIQYQYNKIYKKIHDVLSHKKGDIRSALGGRYAFSARTVIKQDVTLKCNEVRLPYHALCELLQQVIVNILIKSYHFSYADAYKKWYKAQRTVDKAVWDIIDGLIKDSDGLDVIINRNPTIAYGGILKCKVIGINNDYAMSVSLLILSALCADFDGDTINVLYLYNKDFIRMAEKVLSPRQMFISRNDGRCDPGFIHGRDNTINANSLKSLTKYTNEEIKQIKMLQAM